MLDVPLVHLLPHLWQAFSVMTYQRKGELLDGDEIRMSNKKRSRNKKCKYIPSLLYPKTIKLIMEPLEVKFKLYLKYILNYK